MNSILNKSWNNGNLIKYSVVVLRWYIACYMFSYGYSKMTGGQFQVHDPNILKQPLESVDSFYVAWHLFGRSPLFNVSIGLTQCLGAILIVLNRTKLLGALILLPVLINIFIIDVSFTTRMHGFALVNRLFIMILCDLFILYYYRTQMIATFKILTVKLESDIIPRWWLYPIFLVLGFLMDFIFALTTIPIKFLVKYIFHLDIF